MMCKTGLYRYCNEVKLVFNVRLHKLFLMRFRVRPFTLLCTYAFFSRSIGWIGIKVIRILFEDTPLSNFCYLGGILSQHALRDWKPVRGRLGQVLYAKSHENQMKNRMCKSVFTVVVVKLSLSLMPVYTCDF